MDWALFGVFLGATVAAGATGMIFQPGAWYDGLSKPDWTPPKWVFPTAWTTLYVLMSWAATRVAPVPGSGPALGLWSLQISLNTLWTPVFFGAHKKGLGLIILCCLWLAVAAMLRAFWQLDTWAMLMILPYLAWLSVAASLNFWIWRNNRTAD